ncbi:two-component system sensor histidine kinase NtrB [Robiginitomaculum antarcticum]|uniref:two-component system sensor histidine kinase NtrB n=1 Tax=Robiginitomaculum antarcticum TaxID=437507 RepID=UPI00035C399D|nr:PAS domain S-box protein [Robiginitomaculum antarcticum]
MTTEKTLTELDAVLNTIVDGVIVIDADGIIERYNPACVTIFGYAANEVIGQKINHLMPQPYKDRHDGYIKNYAASGEAKIIGIGREVKGLRRDGTIFPMYLSVGELPGQSGRAYIGIIRDLTENSRQQEKFDRLQHDHYHLSRVAAMDQLGAAIAHELNQPLSAIMNYLEAGAAMLNRDEVSHDVLYDILKKSTGQADRAAKILFRLRKFIETGDLEKSKINPKEMIISSLDLIRPSFKHMNIAFEIALDSKLPEIVVSEVQIQQVLVNLIRNACEASDGDVPNCVTIQANLINPDTLKIGIIDTGRGMTTEQYEKLYQPFSTNKKGGLGVGLSISQSIISNHDGRLWAERNVPNGTCFYFTLPASGVK